MGSGRGASGKGAGKGNGQGDNSGNGVGTGAGKPGGTNKPQTQKATAYQDVGSGNGENRKDTRNANVRNDKFTRVTTDSLNATKVKGKVRSEGRERISFSRGAPGGATTSSPLFDVDSNYAPSVESALSRDDIPAPTKKQVRAYFDSLRQSSPKQNPPGEQRVGGQRSLESNDQAGTP